MTAAKTLKIIIVILGIIAVVLLLVLALVPSVKSPTVPPGGAESSSSATAPGAVSPPGAAATVQPSVSADGRLAVAMPRAGEAISSPVAVEGTITGGGWFFEASIPVSVLDAKGRVIGQGTARALSDWMSTGSVPFAASISFTAPDTATGTILFKNDNPSGLSANDRLFVLPITFSSYRP